MSFAIRDVADLLFIYSPNVESRLRVVVGVHTLGTIAIFFAENSILFPFPFPRSNVMAWTREGADIGRARPSKTDISLYGIRIRSLYGTKIWGSFGSLRLFALPAAPQNLISKDSGKKIYFEKVFLRLFCVPRWLDKLEK